MNLTNELNNELNNFDLPNCELPVPFEDETDVELLAEAQMINGVVLTTALFNKLSTLMNFTQPSWDIS